MALNKLPVSFLPGLLECDPNFVEKIYEFKTCLETPPSFWKPRYDNYSATKITFRTLLTEVLTEWCGRMGEKATIRELCGTLNHMRCRSLAEQLKSRVYPMDLKTQIICISEEKPKAPLQNVTSTRISPFNVGPSLHQFVGRKKELRQLKQHYIDSSKEFAWKTVAVLGLGGIGKTQLVNKFLKDPVVADANITWLSGESPDTLRRSVSSIAEALNLENCHIAETIQLIKQCGELLAVERTWLVVIDNADENYDLLREVGIQLHSINNTFIIVTSRLRRTFAQFSHHIDVKELESQDSATLIKINIGNDLLEEDVQALSKALQRFPLAIAQASAFIRETRACEDPDFGIKEYIQEFERRSKELLSIQVDIDPYKKPTLIIWDMTINAIRKHSDRDRSAMALRVLNLLAFLNPDNVEFAVLERIYKASVPDFFPKYSNSSAKLLMEYSLIQIHKESVQLHRLVQEVTRIKLQDFHKNPIDETFGQIQYDEYNEILGVILSCLRKDCSQAEVFHLKHAWQIAVNSETYPTSFNLQYSIPRIILTKLKKLKLHRELYEFSLIILKKISLVGCKRIELDFKMLHCVAESLICIRGDVEAFRVMEDVIEEAAKLFGPTDCIVIHALLIFTDFLRNKKQKRKLQNLVEGTTQRCLKILDSDHEHTKCCQYCLVELKSRNDNVDIETRALAEEIRNWGLKVVPKHLQASNDSPVDASKNTNISILDTIPQWIIDYGRNKLMENHVRMIKIEYDKIMNLKLT